MTHARIAGSRCGGCRFAANCSVGYAPSLLPLHGANHAVNGTRHSAQSEQAGSPAGHGVFRWATRPPVHPGAIRRILHGRAVRHLEPPPMTLPVYETRPAVALVGRAGCSPRSPSPPTAMTLSRLSPTAEPGPRSISFRSCHLVGTQLTSRQALGADATYYFRRLKDLEGHDSGQR